jgi:hypothetical protein
VNLLSYELDFESLEPLDFVDLDRELGVIDRDPSEYLDGGGQ